MKVIDFVLHKQMLPFFNQSPVSRVEKVHSLSTNVLSNSLDPDRVKYFFLKFLMVFLKEYIEKVVLKKKNISRQQGSKLNYPACNEYKKIPENVH